MCHVIFSNDDFMMLKKTNFHGDFMGFYGDLCEHVANKHRIYLPSGNWTVKTMLWKMPHV
jgi:hypothetical protein